MAQINLKVLTDIKQSKKQLEALVTSVDSISKSLSNVSVNPKLTAQITALTNHYKAVAQAAEKVAKVNYNNEIQAQKLAKATAQANKAIADEATAIEKSKTQFAKHQKAVNDDTRAQEKHEVQMKKATAQTQKATEQTQKHSQSLATMIPNIIKWQVAMTAVMLPLRKLQQGLESINETLVETEKRVVALQRVAGSAANASELYKLAQQYGQSFENVADVTERFAKSGYDWSESIKAAEAALTAMNVAELDAEQASEGLIAVMKQYGYEIEDLNYIIGVLNKTSDTAAVTTEELLIALQKTGSTAKNANVSFEETVGLITALSEGTAASGQNIGNALRSLFVFTSDNKALDTFAGLSEGMAETVKKYRMGQASILDIWKGLGGELEGMGSQQGTLEDLFGGRELTADIEAQLTQITDSFAEIYGTAGNYRQNYFIALLDNIEKVTDVTENLGDVTGYSQQENLKYLNTYEGKLNTLTAQWQELANEEQGFLEFKKDLLDLASGLLTVSKYTGGLRTVVILLATGLTMVLVPAIKLAKIKFTELGVAANASLGWIGLIISAISVLDGLLGQIKTETEKETEALNKAKEGLSELQTELDKINSSYEKTIKEIQKYRSVLDDSSSLESEKEKAQSSLLEIQNSLTESNMAYAGSLDLVNGKLEDQIGLTKDMQIQKIVDEAREYLQKNEPAYTTAKNRLSKKQEWVDIGPKVNPYAASWGPKTNALYDFLNKNGYYTLTGVSPVGEDGFFDGVGDILNIAVSFLGTEAYQPQVYLGGKSTQESIKAVKDLISKAGKIEDSTNRIYVIEALNSLLEDLESYVGDSENLMNGNADSKNPIERLTYDQLLSITDPHKSLSEIQKILEDVGAIQKEITKDSAEWRNSLDQIGTGTLDTLVEKLKEARDATKDAYDYENKKKAVLEAEKALLDAQNNRTVRVYNRQTGTWEFASSAKEVQEAQENLDKARLEIEQAAYENIIKLLEDGDATNEALLKVMAHWAAAYGNGDFSGVANTIKSIVKEATGVDLDAPTKNAPSGSKSEESDRIFDQLRNINPNDKLLQNNFNRFLQDQEKTEKGFKERLLDASAAAAYKSIPDNELPWLDEPLYDNGGVLNGLGGIKATTEDEVVLSPEITKRLLSPVPNAQFDTFVKDLGILFGASESAARNGVVLSNRGGNTDSHDTSYTVNGVPISPQIAETKTVKELFELMPLIT